MSFGRRTPFTGNSRTWSCSFARPRRPICIHASASGFWSARRPTRTPFLPPPPRRTQNRFCIESRLWPNLPVAKRLGWRRRIARCARPSTPSLAGSTRSHSTPGPSA
uniref:Uncharacterized protein n=1 Tax=Human herpesvirus 1 TaxID=10298 RepID=A0A2Z4GZX5_HHV1|nr:hypothetical protein [Human alphaherpesvirus 1]